jgi:hypothetical protein
MNNHFKKLNEKFFKSFTRNSIRHFYDSIFLETIFPSYKSTTLYKYRSKFRQLSHNIKDMWIKKTTFSQNSIWLFRFPTTSSLRHRLAYTPITPTPPINPPSRSI